VSSLAFVTPAYGRYDLAAICFEQRRNLINRLPFEANCIVIANDDNLDIADSFNFHTVYRDNEYLGRRFNDGYQEAAKLGYDIVMPVGSDSWLSHSIFDRMPENSCEITTRLSYAVVNATGTLRVEAKIIYPLGISYMFPTELMSKLDYRPCGEFLHRGCDMFTQEMLLSLGAKRTYISGDKLEHIGFNSDTQLSSLEGLMKRFECDISFDPFEGLEKWYPPSLIDKIKAYYELRGNQQ
jgi:hypothetical protein